MIGEGTLALYAALSLATALVSGNNLSACVSTAVGARAISLRGAQLLGWAGYALGLAAQGGGMERTVRLLLPVRGEVLSAEIFAVTVAIFLFGAALRVPLSLTMSVVGVLVGVSVSSGLKIDYGLVEKIVAMWFATPVAASAATYLSVRLASKSRPTNPWGRLALYRLLLVALSFASAYTLGANTLGLLVGLAGYNTYTLLVGVASAGLGALALSGGEIRRVGVELYSLRYTPALVSLAATSTLVEAATLIGVPLSNTQALASAVFGAALGYRFKYLRVGPFLVIVAGWAAAPLTSLVLGYALAHA